MLSARLVTDLGVIEEHRAVIKLYGLSHTERPPAPALIEAAGEAARRRLAAVAGGRQHTTYGFAVVHNARPACFVLIGWWMTDLDLACEYLTSPHSEPHALRPVDGGAVGCLWELDVLAHERAAWWRALTRGGDRATYLADRMTRSAGPPSGP
jgi:hypothetical protein